MTTVVAIAAALAFAPVTPAVHRAQLSVVQPLRVVASRRLPIGLSSIAVQPSFADRPLGLLDRIEVKKGKLTAFGLWFGLNCAIWGFLCHPLMYIGAALDSKRRMLVSRVGNWWGRIVLGMSGMRAECVDAHLLPPADEPVMYVANHCSYLDIPLTGLLKRPMKYISKSEVQKIPVIGQKLDLAKDLVVTRGDRRSEARVFIDAVRALKEGNALLAFPEGTTTTTGKLLPFKRGPFKMAQSAKVRIVPLTISGTYAAWPKGWIGPKRNVPLAVRVHPPLSSDGVSEEELCERARAAVESGLTGDAT